MQWVTDGEKWRAWLVDYSAARSAAMIHYRQSIVSLPGVGRFPLPKRSVNGARVPIVRWADYCIAAS